MFTFSGNLQCQAVHDQLRAPRHHSFGIASKEVSKETSKKEVLSLSSSLLHLHSFSQALHQIRYVSYVHRVPPSSCLLLSRPTSIFIQESSKICYNKMRCQREKASLIIDDGEMPIRHVLPIRVSLFPCLRPMYIHFQPKNSACLSML